jgi:superfamily I DNA/RNA helicase
MLSDSSLGRRRIYGLHYGISPPMNFNEQQRAVINAIDGVYVTIAGPGSGKTACMVERFLNMITKGISPKDILNLTFTNSAATEAATRVGLLNAETIFRTFHSYALELIKKEREYLPFKLGDTVIPVRGEDYQLLFDLVKQFPEIASFRTLQGKLSEWKRANVEPSQAIDEAMGKEYYYALAYDEYEHCCREQGWLDFDSLMREAVRLLETNEDVRNRWKKKYLSIDEGQDCDKIQLKLLQLLFNGNIMIVGDENQCHPPGTVIDRVVFGKGGTKPIIKKVPIEKLINGNFVVSWNKHQQMLFKSGRKIRTARRLYGGPLLRIRTNDRSVEVTPGHNLWVRFVKKPTIGMHFVYLMYRKGFGYRIGTSFFGNSAYGNAISHRCHQEKGNSVWVLKLFSKRDDARLYETRMSLLYGVPELTFQPHNRINKKDGGGFTGKQIKNLFLSIPDENGKSLLREHGLLPEYPMYERAKGNKYQKMHGWFRTKAVNILPQLMEVPSEGRNRAFLVKSITRREYVGYVYSLDVEEDHTYVANGIPVANCIYEWRDARSDTLSKFSQIFPNVKKLYLGKNYRSTKRLVNFFKEILPVDNGLASHMMTENEDGVCPKLIQYSDSDAEIRRVLDQASRDPENSVIIARTNRQLFDVQRIATSKGIKYRNLGKKDFWDLNEVKALLTLAKDINPTRNAAEGLREIIRDHNLYNRYRNSGDQMNSDPIENINNVVKIAENKGESVKDFLDRVRKMTYGRKSRKEKDLMLATVHQAKGREWDNVYIVGVEHGKMPHVDGELSEERRIFFVACSRAAKYLQISWSGARSMFLEGREYEIYEPEPKGEVEGSYGTFICK